jgi:hypothetical protein
MNNVIKVIIKNVYGKPLIYPANDVGVKFANLLKVKTFTKDDVENIKLLGYTFEQVLNNEGVQL